MRSVNEFMKLLIGQWKICCYGKFEDALWKNRPGTARFQKFCFEGMAKFDSRIGTSELFVILDFYVIELNFSFYLKTLCKVKFACHWTKLTGIVVLKILIAALF